MLNLSHEEALKKQRLILSLQNEIDDRDQKLMEMEHKHSEEVAMVRRVFIRLGEEIKYKEKSLLEMECKYNESLNKVHKLMKEKDEVHDAQEGITLNYDVGRRKCYLYVKLARM